MNTKLQCAVSNQLRAHGRYAGGRIEEVEMYVDELQELVATLLTLLHSKGVIERSELIDMLPNDYTGKVQGVLDNEK
jgi:hypothetical protein